MLSKKNNSNTSKMFRKFLFLKSQFWRLLNSQNALLYCVKNAYSTHCLNKFRPEQIFTHPKLSFIPTYLLRSSTMICSEREKKGLQFHTNYIICVPIKYGHKTWDVKVYTSLTPRSTSRQKKPTQILGI